MNRSTERDTYVARCLRVASAAAGKGVQLKKLDKTFAVEVSKAGETVTFPIVTDARLWRETSPEEAFYAVLLDARGWAAADLSDAIVVNLSDSAEKDEVSLMKRDLAEERARMAKLTDLLGGAAALAELYATADLT
jgi:hypothetical protein